MRSLAQFLYQVETTSLPLQVKDLQISSRREGEDDMSLQVGISAIYLSLQAPPAADQVAQNPSGGRTP
jgi:hypothetical protein